MLKSRLKKVPQSARLSAGGGCKCYLDNAHMGVVTSWKVLPLADFSNWTPARVLGGGCEDNGGGRGDGHHIFMMCIAHSRVMGGNVKSQLIWQKRIACVRSMRCHTKACGSYMAVINAILYGLYGCRWFMAWGRLETQVRGGLGSLFWADRLSIEAQPSFIFTPVPIRASLTSSLWLQQQHQLLVKRRRGKPFL